MNHPYFEIDYSNLRPPTYFIVEPTQEEIVKDGERRVYYDTNITKDEEETIENFKLAWKEENKELPKEEVLDIPSFWVEGDYVRYASTNNLMEDKMVNQVKIHVAWLKSIETFDLSERAGDFLKNGNVFIGGRDNFGIPCMVFDTKGIKKIDKTLAADLTACFTFCLFIIRKYMMLPKYIEKFNFIINLNKSKLNPNVNLIKGLIGLFRDNFNGFSGTTFIYQPSGMFKILWNIMKPFLPNKTLDKVKFINSGKEYEMLEYLNGDELEARFGGGLQDLQEGQFWPPSILPKGPLCTNEYLKSNNLSSFTILGEKDHNIFKGENTGAGQCCTLILEKEDLSYMAPKLKVNDKNKKKEGSYGGFWSRFCCCGRNKELEELSTNEYIKKQNPRRSKQAPPRESFIKEQKSEPSNQSDKNLDILKTATLLAIVKTADTQENL